MWRCWIIEKKTQGKQYLRKENILPKHRKDYLKKSSEYLSAQNFSWVFWNINFNVENEIQFFLILEAFTFNRILWRTLHTKRYREYFCHKVSEKESK